MNHTESEEDIIYQDWDFATASAPQWPPFQSPLQRPDTVENKEEEASSDNTQNSEECYSYTRRFFKPYNRRYRNTGGNGNFSTRQLNERNGYYGRKSNYKSPQEKSGSYQQ